jgi:hypothetical protein
VRRYSHFTHVTGRGKVQIQPLAWWSWSTWREGLRKPPHHAQLAHAHHVEAIEHPRNAAKEHLKAHGKK